jgi:hypothetical protein
MSSQIGCINSFELFVDAWINNEEIGEIGGVVEEQSIETRKSVISSILSSQKQSCERLREGFTAKLQFLSMEQDII